MALTTGSKLGSYEILSLLGAGGMGEVYRARDTRLGREVAIKVLPADRMADENRRQRFVQEARAASALNHPNIVTIYEIESADGIDFIVMEYVPGKSLDALIPRQGMRVAEVLRIAIPMADALARAHARGIVHRDLKPANVVVSTEGVVKVLDFGLAKLLSGEEVSDDQQTMTKDTPASPLSHSGTVAGTAGYMSPEQATAGKVDSRSDVFSFGAVIYEMVTGRRAFAGSSTAETLAAVVREQPKAPSEVVAGVPKELDRLILRCLQKDLDRRFQHMLDVKVELNEIKEESDSGPSSTTSPARSSRLRWLATGLAGVLAVATGVWLIWWARGAEIAPPWVTSLTSTPGGETTPTFSPDGNQIAFAWDGEKRDNWDIHIKMVGSTEIRRLTTDAAVDEYPTWSPDGRLIAFLRGSGPAEKTIHVVSPLGGSDRKVSDLEVGWGQLSWSPDGRWLATAARPNANQPKSDIRGIRFVGASDGEARSITSPSGLTYHTDPTFSPDGRRLAYASCTSVYTCQIDVVELGADGAPKGAAQRLTRKAIWMGGGLAWARDGKSLVYSDRFVGRLCRVAIAGGRPPERIEVAGPAARWPTIAVSRDRLAFARLLGSRDIYRFEMGRPAEVVAASSFEDYSPHFSPDGRRFVFESGRGGEGHEIWLAAADGTNPMQLTHGPGLHQGSPRWSPDGRRIAFDSAGEDGHWDIWTVEADGGSLRRLTSDPADDNLPSWSRDGRFLYWSSNRSGAYNVWRAPAAGGSEEQLTHAGGWLPYEAADGKSLFFLRDIEDRLLAVPVGGGPERMLVDCVGGAWGFTVGLSGIYHLGCEADPHRVPLFLLDPATGRDRLLGKLENGTGGITVSPDGKTVLYTKVGGEGSDLMMIENFR